MNRKSFTVSVYAAVLLCGATAAAGQVATQDATSGGLPSGIPPVFLALEGAWEGAGTLLGRPATFGMQWQVGTSGFVHLTFSNAWVDQAGRVTPVLSARAVYRVDGASASGVWVDDRPQRLTLDAVTTDSSVVTHWVAPAENGRTEYVVQSLTRVVVRDYVGADGAERLFAEATYGRKR